MWRGGDVYVEGLWRDSDEQLKVGRPRCLNERIPSLVGDNPVASSDLIEVGGAADAPPLLS